MRNYKVQSCDGSELYCYLWDDVDDPKGIVQIIHGMGEHAGRYAHFAKFLNERGYIAFGDDHRGHGLTETDATRGHRDGDMFADTVRDEVFIYNMLKEEYNLPVMVLGHSYGSFLAQSFLQQGTDCVGVALTGSAKMDDSLTGAGIFLAGILKFFNRKFRMGFLEKFNIKRDGKVFGNVDNNGKLWLTRDPVYRKISADDPMSGVPMSVAFCYYMLKGVRAAGKKVNLDKLNLDTPIGIFSGSMDTIGGMGKSVGKLNDCYRQCGVKHLEYKLYEGARHEVLNEINRDEVMTDIVDFFNHCLTLAEKEE